MPGAIKKVSKPGEGECGNPRCKEPKAPNRYLCEEHSEEADRIRGELETDPKLLYHQRSDSPHREVADLDQKKKRAPRVPTCCYVGCYEHRVPPSPYCFIHEGESHE